MERQHLLTDRIRNVTFGFRTHRLRQFAFIVIAIALWALLGALLLPLLKTPTVTAESRLVVGDQSLEAQAVPGYVTATQQLATTYARLVSSDGIKAAAGNDAVITATPIPESVVIRIDATAATSEQAIHAADIAAQALIEAVAASGGADALARTQRALIQARTAQRQADDRLSAAAPTDKAAVADESFIAEVRVRAITQAYQDQLASELKGSTTPTVTQKAAVTSSERPKLATLGALGGAGLASVVVMLGVMGRRFFGYPK